MLEVKNVIAQEIYEEIIFRELIFMELVFGRDYCGWTVIIAEIFIKSFYEILGI
jgi:hypothetical protein